MRQFDWNFVFLKRSLNFAIDLEKPTSAALQSKKVL